MALYARISSDEQAERGTIDAQRTFLRHFTELYALPVHAEYSDDGVSGTLPLRDRPAGARLLDDAAAGCFGVVLVYRVDRLGRSLAALLSTHAALAQHGVTLRSATEPFDTASPIGTFVFQLLGSMAELERSTLQERMTLGKARRARQGRYIGGALPLGYTLDAEDQLQVSDAVVPGLDITEPELVRDLFARLAGGSTVMAECRRLNALGLPPPRRYKAHQSARQAVQWHPHRLIRLLRNPVYRGVHETHSRHGVIPHPVPALVTDEVWEAAQAQLVTNRRLPKTNAQRTYPLRGLLRCGQCGTLYVGETLRPRRKVFHYYRCGQRRSPARVGLRCHSPRLRAERVEAAVWQWCQEVLTQPGETFTLAHGAAGRHRSP